MANLLIGILGVIIFLFVFWKKTREDYAGEIIFSSAFLILLGILLGSLISLKFFPAWFFWLEFLGAIGGLSVSILRFRIRVYESFEAMIIGLLPWLSLFFLSDSVTNSSLASFVGFSVCLALVFVYYLLEGRYKSFSWYRSGKVGFSGLTTLGMFFLIRASVAIFFGGVLSFVGKSEVFISGSLVFIMFLLIFNLARKE